MSHFFSIFYYCNCVYLWLDYAEICLMNITTNYIHFVATHSIHVQHFLHAVGTECRKESSGKLVELPNETREIPSSDRPNSLHMWRWTVSGHPVRLLCNAIGGGVCGPAFIDVTKVYSPTVIALRWGWASV